jgi:type IV secretory pathway VirB2 component (pilin)
MRSSFVIFIVFFGISLLDAIQGGHLLRILFWIGIGAIFLLADRRKLSKSADQERTVR